MAKEHVLKKTTTTTKRVPPFSMKHFFIYLFFLNIRPCFVPKGEKRQAQKNT